MAKQRKSESVPVQKGPINLDEQYTYRFKRQPECTMNDIRNNEMRTSKQTMTLHEPRQ